jgi:signal transduction histidine kinase
MPPSSWSTDTTMSFDSSHSGVADISGRWLLLARLVWWAVTLLVVVVFAAALPAAFAHVQALCRTCNGPQLTSQQANQLQALGLSLPFYAAYFLALNCVFFVTYFVVACVLFWRMADNRMAFISSLFLVTFGGATFPGTLDALPSLNPTWGTLVAIARFLGIVFLSLFIYLFPDGRFVPSWIRFVALVGLLVQVPDTFFPGSLLSFSHLPRLLVFALFLAYLACPVVVQVYRYRSVSNAVQRQQTKWVVFGLTVAIAGFLGLLLLTATVGPAQKNNALAQLIVVSAYYLFFLLIPLSIGFAILRYQLWDIDIVIKRSLVYGTLTLCVTGLYILLIGSLGTLFRTTGNLLISLIAAGVVAVVFQPLRDLLQRGVNRLLYGLRDEPYVVLARLSQRLKVTLDPDAVLSTIVETVREALKLSYAAIEVKEGGNVALAASAGTPPAKEALRLPLVYQSEPVGTLLIAPRGRDEALTSADLHLLQDLADQIGIAVHTVRLTSDLRALTRDLQRSREYLVTAREEERRRLRRDLHDGLGSVLASLNWRAGAIRSLLSRDPAAADTLVVEQQQTIQAAIGDIRRLFYDLRPPALDELGLVGAIRERAMQQTTSAERDNAPGLRIDVVAPSHLPALPAAVEVAAYRIMQEALANVTHHAHAHRCSICLECSEESLQIEVTDDGIGLQAGYHAGVGLLSMRERAEELGGTCEISQALRGGTRVRACLPLSKE